MENNTVLNGRFFIGYRRNCSLWEAYTIYYFLLSKERLPHIDIEDVRGDWLKQIKDLIKISKYYVLVLDPKTFDRCFFKPRRKNDILLTEIELAIKEKKQIIPIGFNNFDLKKHTRDIPKEVIEKISEAQIWSINSHNPVSINADLDEILKRELIDVKVTQTPIPQDTVYAILKNITDNLLAKTPITQINSEKIYKQVSDSDYFNNTVKYIGLPEDGVKRWIDDRYFPSFKNKYGLVQDETPSISMEPFPRISEKYASIKVHNLTQETIECYGVLKKIDVCRSENWHAVSQLSLGTYKLSWHEGGGQNKQILGGEYAILNLAKFKLGKIVFTLEAFKEEHFAGQKYRFWVAVYSKDRQLLNNFFGCVYFSMELKRFGEVTIWECEEAINKWYEISDKVGSIPKRSNILISGLTSNDINDKGNINLNSASYLDLGTKDGDIDDV